MTTNPVETEVDPAAAEEFAGRLVGILSDSSLALMISIGHQVGLFDTLALLPPATSQEIADAAGLDERYVREWLGAMTTGRIVTYSPHEGTYALPAEHTASLTSDAGPDNLSHVMQFIPLLAAVEQEVVECFRRGGGVPYSSYERFHTPMAVDSATVHDASLIDGILPLGAGGARPPRRGNRRRRHRLRAGPRRQPDGPGLPRPADSSASTSRRRRSQPAGWRRNRWGSTTPASRRAT
jgi:hypothetical protein